MSQISGKRPATSPLSSEFDKRPKLGLSDQELKDLNEELGYVTTYIPGSSPEGVETIHLLRALREVANHASNIDKSWADKNVCKEFFDHLSDEERLDVASIWIEARDNKDWSKFANHCALLPSHRSATLTATLCSPHAGSTFRCV